MEELKKHVKKYVFPAWNYKLHGLKHAEENILSSQNLNLLKAV